MLEQETEKSKTSSDETTCTFPEEDCTLQDLEENGPEFPALDSVDQNVQTLV